MEWILGPWLGIALVTGGTLVLALGLRSAMANELAMRLRDYVDLQERQPIDPTPRATFRRSELSGSFRGRMILPAFKRVGRFLGRFTPAAELEQLRTQLALAENPLGLGPREFYGMRLAFLLLGVWLAVGIVRSPLWQPAPSPYGQAQAGAPSANLPALGLGLAGLYIMTRLPKTWLTRRVRSRQNKIRRALPDALDMLSVCADAGLGFDQSLQRVSERWETPLGLEFGRVVAEMGMGVNRKKALRDLADRAGVIELSSFVAVIVQSDQLGMSITQTLRGQAEQMRVERRFRAQEEARKAPLKMLFPMLLLIFPAMFAVILGPTVPVFNEFFDTLLR